MTPMLFVVYFLSSFVVASTPKFGGPQNSDELVVKVFENHPDAPTFQQLPNWPNIGIAHNDTSISKIKGLEISHYPIKKGRVTFLLDNLLTKDLPKDSTMEIFSYVNGEDLFTGTIPVCPYLAYAELDCPLKAYSEPRKNKIVLQVPDHAEDSRLGFIVLINTPDQELVAQIAGLIDLEQDGTFAKEADFLAHNEL